MNDLNQPTRYFRGLQQGAFMRLEHAASLKGLLKPFKGKGDFEAWASQCFAMRDELIALAQRQVLPQACGHPFHLLPVELAQQTTGAGTTFLRWRKHDRSAMGVALWQELMASPSTPGAEGMSPHKVAIAEQMYLQKILILEWDRGEYHLNYRMKRCCLML